MRKISIIAIATSAISLFGAVAANAVVAIFGTAGAGGANVAWNGSTLTVTDTGNGNFVPKNGFFASNGNLGHETTSIVFSILSTVGGTVDLGGGTFTTTGPGGTISGSIASGDSFVFTTGGASGGSFTFTGIPGNVTYNSTPLYNTSGLLYTGGNFSLEAQNVFATRGATGSYTAVDEATFSAQPPSVPEPASVATFGMGALALLTLAAVARRRTANQIL